MRSVVVVFPASMWAMMPIFRILPSSVFLAITGISLLCTVCRGSRCHPSGSEKAGRPSSAGRTGLAPQSSGGFSPCDVGPLPQGPLNCQAKVLATLPPIVREGPVCLRHLMGVFLLLDRVALTLRREHQ